MAMLGALMRNPCADNSTTLLPDRTGDADRPASKNGILIVEFAEQLRHKGLSIKEAAVEAARIRLRPILMTSFAFILGVLPLVFASGAGSESRHSVGTTVFGA